MLIISLQMLQPSLRKTQKGGVAPESFRRHVSILSIHSIPSHSSIPMNSVPSNRSTSSYHPPSSLIIIRELSSPRSLKSILIQPGEIIFLGRAGKSRYSARNNNGYFDNPSLRAAHALLKCSRRSGRIYLQGRSSTIYDPPDGNCLMNGDKLKRRTLVENGDDITLRAAEGLSTVLNISIVPQFDKPSQLSAIAHVSYRCAYGCEPRHPTSSQHRAVSRIRESEDGPRVFSQSNPSPISQNLNPPKVLVLAFKPSISPELSSFKAPYHLIRLLFKVLTILTMSSPITTITNTMRKILML